MSSVLSTNVSPESAQGMTSAQYLIFGLYIPLFSYLYNYIATYLNDNENYQTDVDYDDALIGKHLVFQIVNNFTALFFVAFAKRFFFNDCIDNDCVKDIRELLIWIFIIRYILLTLEFVLPVILKSGDAGLEQSQSVSTGIDDTVQAFEDPELRFFVDEMERGEYPGPFKDYLDACIQFGYVTLFCSVVPLIAPLSIAENLIRMRLGGWKLCQFVRRPYVELVEDVGTWTSLMDSMAFLGFMVNTGLVVFTGNSFSTYPMMERALIFLVAEQSLMFYKGILQNFFPSPPEWIDDIQKRQEYVVMKYKLGKDEDDDEVFSSKGNLEDPVDVDRLTLYDVRKEKLLPKHYKAMEVLEEKRRLLLRDLRAVKEQLQEAYKTETFNESTGIGETKHGLSLGHLTVKLLEIQQLFAADKKSKDDDIPPNVRIKVDIASIDRSSNDAGPPVGDHSYSKLADITPEKGIAVFDQVVGPFFPIKTLKAYIKFDVLDGRKEKNNAVVGTAKVDLTELQEQTEIEKQLPIKIIKDDDAADTKESFAKLYVKLQFSYSKVLPLRTKIYHIQDSLREVEKQLVKLKAGNVEEKESET